MRPMLSFSSPAAQRAVAVGVVRARLAVVGGLDLHRARVLRDLEDLEVIQLVEDLREGLRLDLECLIVHDVTGPGKARWALPVM